MPPKRTGAKKRPTVPKNTAADPYATAEALESFCRRCVVYHQTGVILPPDPPPTICQNKKRLKRSVRNQVPLDDPRKKTTFGQGRVGVSCEAYGVRHCTCCNPSLMEQLQNASTSRALNEILGLAERSNRLAPKTKRSSSVLLDTTIDEVVNKYKPKKPPPKPTYQPIVIDDSIDFNILPETSPEPIEIDTEIDFNMLPETSPEPIEIDDTLPVSSSVIELNDSNDTIIMTDQNSDISVIDDTSTNDRIDDFKVKIKSPKPLIGDNESSASLSLKQHLANADKDIRNLFKKNTNLILPPVKSKLIVDLTKPSCSTSGAPLIDLTQSPDIVERPNKSSSATPDCPICFEPVGKGMFKNAMSTICGHIFCGDCLKTSIRLTKACPTCRQKLTLKGIHPIYL